MNQELCQLVERMRNELNELEMVLQRVSEGWQRAKQSSDDFYVDSVALNLHGFYSGLERIFALIAAVIDGSKPTGDMWHKVLLQQMMEEVPEIRPAVISQHTSNQLDEFRGFRHIVRNVYTFKFTAEKIETLVEHAPVLFSQVQRELLSFAEFLEQQT